MKVLFIAPIPPPVNGQSLASKVFFDYLSKKEEVQIELIDFKKPRVKWKIQNILRFYTIIKVLLKIYNKREWPDIIYLTISESRFGNIKDILTYYLLRKHLSKMIIHLHGGAGFVKLINKQNSILYKVNKFFLQKLKSIIVLSDIHKTTFNSIVDPEKILIIPNFADDEMFITSNELVTKFDLSKKMRILFLSNLIPGKGFQELFLSYVSLSKELQDNIEIDFAGGFQDIKTKNLFLSEIKKYHNIKYHGIVQGDSKVQLFKNAMIFCLPTYYAYEGQPISILESYASGCFVITTNHSGIPDIFESNKNGFLVEKNSVDSLRIAIEKIYFNKALLYEIGSNNLEYAKNSFSKTDYNSKLWAAFKS